MITQKSLDELPKKSMLGTFFSKSSPHIVSYADALTNSTNTPSTVSTNLTQSTAAPAVTPLTMRRFQKLSPHRHFR
jgi:hypothetical protein